MMPVPGGASDAEFAREAGDAMPARPTKKPSETIRSLLAALDQAYNHRTWHGTNLRGSIRGLSPAQALWRPVAGRHNIWEEVLHAAYWKYAVRQRLTRGRRGGFPFKGSNWFAAPSSGGPAEWKRAVALLQEFHDSLLDAVRVLPDARLNRPVHGSKWSAFDTILGVAYHDIYHAGQIQLLKRLQKS
jgi:DinB family protein